jgi:hypothetical protein
MAKETVTAADVFAGRARKFNHYQEGERREGQSCSTCVRRRFSHPYTCGDGWPINAPWEGGRSTWEDRGATCINYSDDPKCRVD